MSARTASAWEWSTKRCGRNACSSVSIEGLGAAGDLLVMHSTSGASPNLSRAAAAARARGVRSVALLASGGGTLKDEVDLAIVLPTENTARAQEIQLAIGHAVAEWVDRQWAGRDRDAD